MGSKVTFDEERCKGCEICVHVCPRGILYMAERRNDRGYRPASIRDMDQCTGCAICAQMCPDLVIDVWRGSPARAGARAGARAPEAGDAAEGAGRDNPRGELGS